VDLFEAQLLPNLVVRRLVSYFELLGVMLATWYFEIYTVGGRRNYQAMIAADFLKLLTCAVIFAIFCLNKRVRFLLLQKYLAVR